ncbi:hypothetical protein A0J61_01130 [Choanephora cucurbitarum]|uniref:Uncharacterized protein n=1 Tax=Choanephora cucurbitarum TaxID=101091 RepID=A0A1C7NQY0_9FUNG|nr:hypothetical protein A0J61_01130 [Choanephora cucurbitarum]
MNSKQNEEPQVANNKPKPLEHTLTLKKSLSRSTLRNNSYNHSPTKTTSKSTVTDASKQLAVEATILPEHQALLMDSSSYSAIIKRSSSTPLTWNHTGTISGDTCSIISGSESTRSNNKRKKKANIASSFANPTDLFAQNLSDAVMDADTSDDQESYVYRDKPTAAAKSPIYTIPPPWVFGDSTLDSSFPSYHDRYYSSTESNTEGGAEYYHGCREKFLLPRRPAFHSAASETRPISSASSLVGKSDRKVRPLVRYKSYYDNHPSDEECVPLVRSRPPRRRKGNNADSGKSKHSGLCMGIVWLLLALSSGPLMEVEVVGISNVLGTQKELMFNLQVRAKNSNWWTIRMTNTAFSVFASSHYVPTSSPQHTDIDYVSSELNDSNSTLFGADPAEFLGTIYHLEDPLVYQAGSLLHPITSTATSQIQIRTPGATRGDMSGNERWSLLIRYPYELTVRGVLKYQALPFMPLLMQLHSVRVCKMSRIDPASGKISDDVSIPKKSICDDPSPIEGL